MLYSTQRFLGCVPFICCTITFWLIFSSSTSSWGTLQIIVPRIMYTRISLPLQLKCTSFCDLSSCQRAPQERHCDYPNAGEALASIANPFGTFVPDLRFVLPSRRTTEPPTSSSSFSSILLFLLLGRPCLWDDLDLGAVFNFLSDVTPYLAGGCLVLRRL